MPALNSRPTEWKHSNTRNSLRRQNNVRTSRLKTVWWHFTDSRDWWLRRHRITCTCTHTPIVKKLRVTRGYLPRCRVCCL